MNNQLKSKFFNRFARFDRDNQCIVVEFNDGAEGQIEKIDGEYILDFGVKQIEGEENIFKVICALIDKGNIINLGIADFEN